MISKEAQLGIVKERKQFQKKVKDWNRRYAVRQRGQEAPVVAPWVWDKSQKGGEAAWYQQQAQELPMYHRRYDSNTHKQKCTRSKDAQRLLYWYNYEEQQKTLQGETAAVFANHPMIGGQHDPYVCGFEMKKAPTMRNRGFLLRREGTRKGQAEEVAADESKLQGKSGTARERQSRRLHEEIAGAKNWWAVNKRLPTGVPMRLPPKQMIGNGEAAELLKGLAIGMQRYRKKVATSSSGNDRHDHKIRFRLRKIPSQGGGGNATGRLQDEELSIYEDSDGSNSDEEHRGFYYDSSDDENERAREADHTKVEPGSSQGTKWELFEHMDLVVHNKGHPRRQHLADRLALGGADDDDNAGDDDDGDSGAAYSQREEQYDGIDDGTDGSRRSVAAVQGNMLSNAQMQQAGGRRQTVSAASVRTNMRPTPPPANNASGRPRTLQAGAGAGGGWQGGGRGSGGRGGRGGITRQRRGSLHMAQGGMSSASNTGEDMAKSVLAVQTNGGARVGVEYFQVRIGLLDKATGQPVRASGLVMFLLGAELNPFDRPPPIRTNLDGCVSMWLRRGVYRLSVCHGAGASTAGRVHRIFVDKHAAHKSGGATVTYLLSAADVIKHDRVVRDLRARILQRFFREEFLRVGTTAHARLWIAPRLQAAWRGNKGREWLQLAHAAASMIQTAANRRTERKVARKRVAEVRAQALKANAERKKREAKQQAAAAMKQRHGSWQMWVNKLTMVQGDNGERTVRRWQPYLLALGVSGMHLNFFVDESRKAMSAPIIDLRKICSVDRQLDEPGPEDGGPSRVFQLVVGHKYSKSYSLSLVGDQGEDLLETAACVQKLRYMAEDAREATELGHLTA
jgi:hypothetical protein